MKKLLYFLIDFLDLFCFWPRHRAVEFIRRQKVRCIHYGSGEVLLPGWLNVDMLSWLHIRLHDLVQRRSMAGYYQRVDIIRTHPFPDNYFAFAYGQDLIEHFNQRQLVFFLLECRRTLRPGGVLRLSFPALPNMLKRLKLLLKKKWTSTEIIRDTYGKFGHQGYYTAEGLRVLAGSLGFKKFQICEYRSSAHGPLRGLDFRFGNNVFVELTK